MSATRRLLRSPLIDVLIGPHGVDRYLELIRPQLTVNDARAEVTAVHHQTARSVTLTLRPNAAWAGFRAGQFIRVGVEIDGVRRTRTYSPASSQHDPDLIELTVTVHPGGLVSRHLNEAVLPGTTLHLDSAAGSFVLPEPLPDKLVLISGGSGITPVLSMLRTLRDESYAGEVEFLHYARTRADWLYRQEAERLAARAEYIATREGGRHIGKRDFGDALVAVCGPPPLIEAVERLHENVISESFTPPTLALTGQAATGTIRFLRSDTAVNIGEGTLLEQAEAAGLEPDFGCRMGICHTCTCRKTAGSVRNVLTGEVSGEEDEDVQLCISVPAGDVALQI